MAMILTSIKHDQWYLHKDDNTKDNVYGAVMMVYSESIMFIWDD